MSAKLKMFAIAILTFLGIFTASAFAQSAVLPDPAAGWLDLLTPVYEAFVKGDKLYAGMLALIAAVAMLKRYAPVKWGMRAFVHGDVGGSLLTLTASFAAAMITGGLGAGVAPSWAMVKAATLIAVGAAGGYSLIKKLLVEPLIRPYAAKAPAWLKMPLMAVLWFFDRPMPTAKADAAGAKAVEAKPATGLGSVKDVE